MDFDYIDKILESGCINHAYLIEVGDFYNTDFVIDIVKKILKKEVENSKRRDQIYRLIDNNSYGDLKIIKPEGNYIKKEQLIELMDDFKKTSLTNTARFYVIEYAENLNQASANTILKFLEEPDNDIIAILITKNIYGVLDTIVSRCQVLNVNTDIEHTYEMDVFQDSLEYFKILVEKKDKAIAYLSELYLLKADEIKKILKNWTIFYEKAIECCYNIDETAKKAEDKEVMSIIGSISSFDAVSKLKKIDSMLSLIDLNVNTRVILDMLFDLEECI